MNPKIRVLILASWYPSVYDTVLGIFNQRFAQAVAPYADIRVLYVRKVKKLDNTLLITQETDSKNVFCVSVFYRDTGFMPLRLWRYFRAYQVGWKTLRQDGWQPQILHLLVVYPAALIAMYWHFRFRLPFIISENWTGYAKGTLGRGGQYILTKFLMRRAASILNVSAHYNELMQQLGLQGNFAVVPNVVDTALFSPPKEKKVIKNSIELLHVSSLFDENKNVTMLLNAFAEVRQKIPNLCLQIIGNGKDRAVLEQLAKKLHLLDESVFFQGQKESVVIAEAMQKADIFVLSSNFEVLPCVLLEALSSGLPVVATETGGIATWVNDSNGQLSVVGDQKDYEKALIHVINHLQSYDNEAIAQKTTERCSYESIGKSIAAYYRKALTSQR